MHMLLWQKNALPEQGAGKQAQILNLRQDKTMQLFFGFFFFSNGSCTGLSTEMRKYFSVTVCKILQHFKV